MIEYTVRVAVGMFVLAAILTNNPTMGFVGVILFCLAMGLDIWRR